MAAARAEQRLWPLAGLAAVAALLAGCATRPPQPNPAALKSIPEAVPHALPKSRYGNPSSYTVLGRTYHVLPSAAGYDRVGLASWYGPHFDGERTSSGERYNMYAMTAASKVLPLPTYVRVTNLRNGRQVVVKVNDRGPFHRGRIIDLSYAAAYRLGITGRGTAWVRVQAITPGQPPKSRNARAPTSRAVATSTAQPRATRPAQHTTRDRRYLQAGAFDQIRHARHRLAQLRLAGFHRAFIQHPRPGAPLYRVRVGPFASVSRAARARARLGLAGIAATVVDP